MHRLDERISRGQVSVRFALLAVLLAGISGSAAAQTFSVSGTITDDNGDPVAGASVAFFQQPAGTVVFETTNGAGVYVCDVPAGCYRMMVSDPAFGQILYPGTIVFGEEELISVEAAITGLDLQIPPIHSVGGTLTASGALPAQTTVEVFDRNGNPTIATGNFSIAEWDLPLPEGQYTVLASDATFPGAYSARWFNNVYALGDATVVNLTADRNDIDFALEAKPVLRVDVTRPGGGKGAGDRVVSYTRGGEYSPLQAITNASGVASISGENIVPGYQYQVTAFGTTAAPFWANPGPAGTFASFPEDDGDWFVATPGLNPVIPIVAGIPGSIAGTVTDATTGDPIAGVVVRTTDPLPATRLGFSFFSSAATTASGAYTIGGIQKDRFYGVTATPSTAPTNYYLPADLDFFAVTGAVTGKDIELTKGTRFNVTVTERNGGAPVPFAVVYAYFANCSGIAGLTFTSATGVALTPVVPAGNYKIFVQPQISSNLAPNWAGDAATCAAGDPFAGVAGAATPVAVALDPASAGGGHEVSGRVTDSATGEGLFASVQFVNTLNSSSVIFAFTDFCGFYSAPGVPDGTYNVFSAATGYAPFAQTNGLVVAGVDVTKNITLTPNTGAISGVVTKGGQKVQGAQVCTTTGFCDETDSSGYYRIANLAAGTFQLICYNYDNLEPEFFNNKTTKATADNVVVTNNATATGRNFDLGDISTDAGEPDGAGPGAVLSRPENGSGANPLQPQAPLTRSFESTEDTDWFRFTASNGVVYRVSVTGGGFTQYGVFSGVFDGVTHARDAVASVQIFSPSGWTATGTGERLLGISSALAGTYTITLTAGTVTPTPTVTSINPTSGPAAGGTNVTITGTNFAVNATVTIGGVAATSVVRVNATTITCKSPALAAGTLNDVVVDNPSSAVVVGPNRPAVSGTLVKGWLADFNDVPLAFLYHTAIEKIFRAGITTGCGGGNFCANAPITRDAMAAFILRAKHGGAYVAPDPTGDVWEDVKTNTFLARWMEQFGREQITTGCGTTPGASLPNYCATAQVTRDGMAVFLLKGKNGSSFLPPVATGDDFCDVLSTTFLARWMEQLKVENITQGCGSVACPRLGGVQPNFCPLGTVTRGEMAPFLVRAMGL